MNDTEPTTALTADHIRDMVRSDYDTLYQQQWVWRSLLYCFREMQKDIKQYRSDIGRVENRNSLIRNTVNEQRISQFVNYARNIYNDAWVDQNLDSIRSVIEPVLANWNPESTSQGMDGNQIAWSIIAPQIRSLRNA